MFGFKKKDKSVKGQPVLETFKPGRHRPDLRNYSYDDLSFLYKFEHMTDEERLFLINGIDNIFAFHDFSAKYSWLDRFGITFYCKVAHPELRESDIDRYKFTSEDGYKYTLCDRVEFEPWHQSITDEEFKALETMELPTHKCDNFGVFGPKDKTFEGKYDLGYNPQEVYKTEDYGIYTHAITADNYKYETRGNGYFLVK